MLIKALEQNQSLQLKNDGKLEIFFIGVGTASAQNAYQTNFIIIKGDTHIMVDFGQKGQIALWETARLKTTDIEILLPTHSHADHIGGFETLALMNRYVGQRIMQKELLKMVITPEYQRVLWDSSLRGGLEWNEEKVNGEIRGVRLGFGDFFQTVRPKWKTHSPRETFTCDIGEIHLELFRTMHIPAQSPSWEASFLSYGMMVDERVFISGDTRFDPELIEIYGEKAEVLFHDVQFFPGAVHAWLEDLRTLPPAIKDKMLFKHYADNWKDQEISEFAGWVEQGKRYVFN